MFAIQDLLVDKSFLALDRQLNAFNIFDVLNLREYEIRHTRFLAHLLDPCGTHGLGTAFLRNFLLQASAQLALGERAGLLDDIHKFDLDLARVTAEISLATCMDSADVDETRGERATTGSRPATSGRLDILVQIPRRDGEDVAIAIENKINAKESHGQLARYRDWVTDRFAHSVLLYLTVNDDEADKPWNSITYSNVVYPALELTTQSCATLGPAPALMLSHYMGVLRDKVEAEAAYADADRIAQDLLRSYPAAKAAIDVLQREWQGPIDGRALDSSWGLYNRYKAAFRFLSRYHTDDLSKALQWFSSTWPQRVTALTSGAMEMVIDDSNRSYMRFLPVPAGSELRTLSRQYAQKAKANGKFAWTSGENAILFELRCYAVPPPDALQNAVEQFGWNMFLVVGPLAGVDRIGFITRLRELLNQQFGTKAAREGDYHPVVRQGKISPTYFSALKWKLPARNVLELERDLSQPQLLSALEQAARLVERALEDVGQ